MLSMSSKSARLGLTAFATTAVLVAGIFIVCMHSDQKYAEFGVSVVRNLYTYKDELQCAQQDGFLQQICSEDVYAQLTLKKNGTLHTFVRAAREPTTVDIIKSTDDYVIYSLNADQIDDDCRYVLFFEVENNQVVEARECELYDFISFDESLY